MVAQILTYARPNAVERQPVDLVPLVQEVRDLVQLSYPMSVTLDCTLPARDAMTVVANRGQLTQILLNLCVNAIDAIDIDAWGKINARADGKAASGAARRCGLVHVELDAGSPDRPGHLVPLRNLAAPAGHYRSGSPLPERRYARLN